MDERAVVDRVERLTLRDLRFWVNEGWVRPAHDETGPVFDEIDVARIRLICDFTKDMAIPTGALPPLLSLIDQLHRTRRELRWLSEALETQPDAVQREVIGAMRRRIHHR